MLVLFYKGREVLESKFWALRAVDQIFAHKLSLVDRMRLMVGQIQARTRKVTTFKKATSSQYF